MIPKDSSKGYSSALIEFKYLKKEEYNLKEVMEGAINQAKSYSSYDEFKNIDKLKTFVVVIVCDKVYYEEAV